MLTNNFQHDIHRNEGKLNYIESDIENFDMQNFYQFLQEKLDKINSILENTEQKNGLKYNLALQEKNQIEKQFKDYLRFKNEEILDVNYNGIIMKENLIEKMNIIFDDMSFFLETEYGVILKIDEDDLKNIVENISEKLKNNSGIISQNKLNYLLNNEIFDKIYNFLYTYQGELAELRTNPKNKIFLDIIDGNINLYVNGEYTKEELDQKMKNSQANKEEVIEEQLYDTEYKKAEEPAVKNLLNQKPKEKQEPYNKYTKRAAKNLEEYLGKQNY